MSLDAKEVAYYSVEHGFTETCKKFRCSRSTVVKARQKFGIREQTKTDAFERAMRDVRAGMSRAEAAQKHGVSVSRLGEYLRGKVKRSSSKFYASDSARLHPALLLFKRRAK